MVSFDYSPMKAGLKTRSKRKVSPAKRVLRGKSGNEIYLMVTGITSLLNLIIGAVVLSILLLSNNGFHFTDRGFFAGVQADPSTGLIVPQKPLGVHPDFDGETRPLEGDPEGRGWLKGEDRGEDRLEKKADP